MNRFVLLAACIAAGCTASPPDERSDPPDAGMDITGPQLSLDSVASTTEWSTVPVSGRGPASGTVLVDSPRGSFSTDIASDGRFCMDVALSAGNTNTLKFRALDELGQYSNEITVEVEQNGSPPDPPDPTTATNLLRGGSMPAGLMRDGGAPNAPAMTVSFEGGGVAQMVDGDHYTFARISEADWSLSFSDYLVVSLGERGTIDLMRVVSDSACVMEDYVILASDVETPHAPEAGLVDWYANGENINDWITLRHVTDGDGDDTFQLLSPTMARHIAIIFQSEDCAGWLESGKHEIFELEAWTAASDSAPAPQAPSCASGGM